MGDSKNVTSDPAVPNPEDGTTGAVKAATQGLSGAGRLALIHAYQAQALTQSDPLAANIQVVNSELLMFASRISLSVDETLRASGAPAETYEQFAKKADTYLRFVRQFDRLAQIERQIAKPTGPAKRG